MHFNLGEACRALGEENKAIVEYEEAIRLKGNYIKRIIIWEMLYQT